MIQFVRLVNRDGVMLLQDCSTELCLDLNGNFTLPAGAFKPQLYPRSREFQVFDTVIDAQREAGRRTDCKLLEVVDYKGLRNLNKGQEVVYVAGMGRHHCLAIAKVAQEPSFGATGCMIILHQIVAKGDKADVALGEEIDAGARELYT